MIQAPVFITPFYAAFFGIMLVALSWRVTKLRQKYSGPKMSDTGHNELTAAVRAQGNFIEYLPLALFLMALLENMNTSSLVLHLLGLLLIVARLLHLHGLNEPSGNGPGRRLGTRLTWAQIAIASVMCFAGAFGFVL